MKTFKKPEVAFAGRYLLIAILFLFSCNNQSAQDKPDATATSGGLILPKGFSATVFAESLGKGRHITVNSNGDVYVSLDRLKNNKGIAALRDKNKDGKADQIEYFGKFEGTGIGIYNGYLYFGSDVQVIRYKLKPGELIPESNYEVIATGFEKTYQHSSKPFKFDPQGHLYVNVGAPSNACQTSDRAPGSPGIDSCPLLKKFAGIWRFDANKPNQDQMKDGLRYATGLRNCMALAWNTQVKELFAVQHGRDQLHELWPEIYSEDQGVNLPAEEFFMLKEGSDGGWPYCYYDDRQHKKVVAPEYGGDGKKDDRCAGKLQPIMTFPAHIAPNDLTFYTGNQFPEKYKNGAFIAFHGSWNRAPQEQEGFYVAFVPFSGGKPSGKWEIFADGFAGVAHVNSPGDAKYRPCGLDVGPDGSLYVVEDNNGRVWKISYNK